jgi:hypothetical protein
VDAEDGDAPVDDPHRPVTNPERFQMLHDGAHRLLDELERGYVVTRGAPDSGDPRGGYTGGVLEVVKLTPERPDQGALTVTFTGFPGLDVHFGWWHHELYPRCGCDVCDDDPSQLLEELNRGCATSSPATS